MGRGIRAELRRTVPAFGPRHVLGVLTLVVLCSELVTGLLLMVYYRPSIAAAHHSMGVITDEVRLGWLVRSWHRWSSDLLVLFGLLHLIQVYFRRAFRASSGGSWLTGIFLLVVILAFAFTGTLLPWDQYAYWSIDSSRQTIVGIPLLGSTLLSLFWGGWDIGEEVLLRFYAFHVGILPWMALACLTPHLIFVWRSGLYLGERPDDGQYTPATRELREVALDLLIAVMLLVGLILSIATVFPPPLLARADALTPLLQVQPRWYLLAARQLLRGVAPGRAVLIVIVLFALLCAVPLLDRAKESEPTWRKLIRWALGASAVATWLLLAAQQYRA